MKKIEKNDTMHENDLQRVYIYLKHPRGSKIYSDRGFVNLDNGSLGGTHWTCFTVKDKKSKFFDNFGGQTDKFLLNQSPKTITYHNYKIQDMKFTTCGSFSLNFFYLIERMTCYDTFLKT